MVEIFIMPRHAARMRSLLLHEFASDEAARDRRVRFETVDPQHQQCHNQADMLDARLVRRMLDGYGWGRRQEGNRRADPNDAAKGYPPAGTIYVSRCELNSAGQRMRDRNIGPRRWWFGVLGREAGMLAARIDAAETRIGRLLYWISVPWLLWSAADGLWKFLVGGWPLLFG